MQCFNATERIFFLQLCSWLDHLKVPTNTGSSVNVLLPQLWNHPQEFTIDTGSSNEVFSPQLCSHWIPLKSPHTLVAVIMSAYLSCVVG